MTRQKQRLWFIAVILAFAVLASGTVLGAPAADLGPAQAPNLQPAYPTTDELEGGGGALPEYPPPVLAETTLSTGSSQGATPDGTFLDPATWTNLAGQGASLQRVSGSYAPGIYMARDWRPVSKADFPMVVGGHDTFTWREIETSESSYNWTRLDALIAANAATGKKTAFGITTYNGRIEGGIVTPNWLITNYPQTVIDCGSGWRIPRYWNSVYKTKYGNFVRAVANRYKNNPDVAWVQIGVGLYGEIQPADDRDDTCVRNAMTADGFTDHAQHWINTINSIIDIFMTNFNTGKPVFLVYTPSFVNANEKCYTTEYGASNYRMGLFAGGIYANQTGIFRSWPTITYPANCEKWDPIVYWNNSASNIPIAFESYRYMLPDLDNFYWGILNALNKRPDYLNLESDLFFSNKNDPVNSKITENFPMMYFANQYLGKTIQDTPNVWVAMREYDLATNGFGFHNAYVRPQYGNYDFWLTQDQTATGGRTMTATTVSQYYDTSASVWRSNPYYDPLLAGKGPQGWSTRRTNRATGNDYFYLNIADQFVSTRGIQNSAVITVTWFDVITATGTTWFLQYKDISGNTQSRQVTRANTKRWVTTVFYINDANFANNMTNGNDFALYNGGVADLYVHFVAVGPLGGPTPTTTPTVTPGGPTSTPTATGTPTLTPTPTSTVPPGTQILINAGGGNYTDSTGKLWLADRPYALGGWGYWSAGTTATFENTSTGIGNTIDDLLYQTERYWTNTGGYTVTLPNGNYYVELRFAEIYCTNPGGANPCTREFDVLLQGNMVLDNLNLINRVGAFNAFNATFPVLVTDGLLRIQFLKQGDNNPKVNAIWVYPAGGEPPPTATFTATPTSTPGGPTSTPTPTLPAGQTVTYVFQHGLFPTTDYSAPDTYISNYGTDQLVNYCTNQALYVRNNDYQAALLYFPLPGIPSNAVVVSATLSIYADYRTNDNPLTLGAYRMLRAWDPCTANWRDAQSGILWGQAGANSVSSDRSSTADDFVTLSATMAWHSLNVGNMVQTWIANPSSNRGLILKTVAGGASVRYNLRSADFAAIPSTRPKLTVVFQVPGTPSPSATPTQTRTFTPTATHTPTTPTSTATATITPGGPTLTPTPTPSHTYTSTPSSTPTQTWTPSPTPTIAYQVRVNAGGPNYTDTRGNLWLADRAYTPGSWGYVGGNAHTDQRPDYPIHNTTDPLLYRTDRFWLSPGGSYRFDVPVPGLYEVEMHFAETYHFAANKRIFNVDLESTRVLTNFDIFAAAGNNHHYAVVVTRQIMVADGTLNIDFKTVVDTPTVMAIRVRNLVPATATPTTTFTVTRTPTATQTPSGPTATPTATNTPTRTHTFTVTPTPTTAPGCPDAFEPDDTMSQARAIIVGGGAQRRNFHMPYDVDWVSFSAAAGTIYTIWTANLAGDTDTIVDLWTADGQFINSNDDDPALGTRASRIIWQAQASGTYYLKVWDYNYGGTFGCSTGYDLEVFAGAPSPTATPTRTSTRTHTVTQTATHTATATATGTATPTPTETALPSKTATPSATGTATVTGTATATGTATNTATATATPSNTPTVTPSHTGTATATATATLVPTQTRTATRTATGTATGTATRTGTATFTPTRTRTLTTTPTRTPVGERLACNSTVSGDTRPETNNFVVYSCGGGSETGPEKVYYLQTTEQTTIIARILSYMPNGDYHPDVFILSSLDPAACVPGGYGNGSTPSSAAIYFDAPPGVTYIVVDGRQGWAERYSLQVQCTGAPVDTPTPTPVARVVLPVILSELHQ